MTSTPLATARSLGPLETLDIHRILETEQSQTPHHRNAKGKSSNLAWGDPGIDVPAATGPAPPKVGRSRIRPPSKRAMNQLMDVLGGTNLSEAPLSTKKSRKKENRKARKVLRARAKKEAAAAMTPEQTQEKRAKRMRKQLNRQFHQKYKQGKKAVLNRGPSRPSPKRSACLSQMFQDDQAIHERHSEHQEVEEDGVDTASTDVQYSPDERPDRAMHALEAKKAMRALRKGRKASAWENTAPHGLYQRGGDADDTDTMMD